MQVLYWKLLLNVKYIHKWVCCWLLSLKVTVAWPFPRRLSSSCVEVMQSLPFTLLAAFAKKALLEVQMAFTEMMELFCLWKRWCTLEDIYRTCSCTTLCGDVCEVEVGTVCVPIQAVTTRWHHDSGNKIQMNPKGKAILPVLGGLLQTQNTGWICGPFCELESTLPCKLRFEQNGLISRWQSGIYDLGWKPSEPGWPLLCLGDLCLFETKAQSKIWAIGASLSQNQKGFA